MGKRWLGLVVALAAVVALGAWMLARGPERSAAAAPRAPSTVNGDTGGAEVAASLVPPVAGARISGTAGGAISAGDGAFEVELRFGSAELTARKRGYAESEPVHVAPPAGAPQEGVVLRLAAR